MTFPKKKKELTYKKKLNKIGESTAKNHFGIHGIKEPNQRNKTNKTKQTNKNKNKKLLSRYENNNGNSVKWRWLRSDLRKADLWNHIQGGN